MMRTFTAALSALALVAATATPALAHDHRGGGSYGGGYYDRSYYDHRRHDDNGDAVAAGVVGLILGVALGAAVSQSNNSPPPQRYDNSYYAPPPQAYPQSYQGGYQSGYAPSGYGGAPGVCVRQVMQFDPYSGQTVPVNVRTPC